LDRRHGRNRGGGDRQPVPGAVPDAGTPSIDQHSNAPETWQNGRVKGLQGERNGKVQWPISLGGDGMGELPCPPSDAAGQSVDVAGGM